MKCDKCGSKRILSVNARCSDMFDMQFGDEHKNGYVPKNLVFGEGGYGDYVKFDLCLDCGKMQGDFPINQEEIEYAMSEMG